MGAWRILGTAAVTAAFLFAARASGGTVVEPIARLSLEGGYDSNPLYDDSGAARSARLSPDVGLRLRNPLLDLAATYGGELLYFSRDTASESTWNHRAAISIAARPTRRTAASGTLGFSEAVDPAALARFGVFRVGPQRAVVLAGRGRLDWRADRRIDGALTFTEQTVAFDDGTGGGMHAPGVEALWRYGRRLQLGAAYGFGVFQSFQPAPRENETALSHAIRGRLRWRATRHVSVNAYAGPALWLPKGDSAFVPEALVEVLVATRGLDLRVSASHGLGIGASADPGLVDALEFGGERRFGRSWFVRGAGGFWRSGAAPTGADAVTGYVAGGEAGIRLENDLRLSLTAARYGRVDTTVTEFDRTTVGLRVGWELPVRR
jgi:hypothetical protein